MLIETLSEEFRPVRVTDTTDAAYPARPLVMTRPSGEGTSASQGASAAVVDMSMGSRFTQNSLIIVPIGQGSGTFNMLILGWRKSQYSGPSGLAQMGTGAQPVPTGVWVPYSLGEFAVTIGNFQGGLGSTSVPAADYFASTISVVGTTANPGVNANVVSPGASANFPVGFLTLDLQGSSLIEFLFKIGTASSANALVSFY
jgi:hypothetical protein